jgi:hypothetical protein
MAKGGLFSLLSVVLLGGGLAVAQTQAVQAQGFSQYRIGGASQTIHWLRNPQVQKEIELVDEQAKKIEALRKEFYEESRQMYSKLKGVDRAKYHEKQQELYKALAEKTDRRLKEILLPQQIDRLNQIQMQMQLRTYGNVSPLFGGDLLKELGITEDQQKKMQEAQVTANKEMQEKIRKFYEQARKERTEKVLDVLSKEQRTKLKKMLGADFEWKTNAAAAQGGERDQKSKRGE